MAHVDWCAVTDICFSTNSSDPAALPPWETLIAISFSNRHIGIKYNGSTEDERILIGLQAVKTTQPVNPAAPYTTPTPAALLPPMCSQ